MSLCRQEKKLLINLSLVEAYNQLEIPKQARPANESCLFRVFNSAAA